ncbi:hypothetical protein LXL04_029274 [Taraxacum kok-saghyz]
MAFLLKQPHFRELRVQLSVIFRDVGDGVVFGVIPIEELIDIFPGGLSFSLINIPRVSTARDDFTLSLIPSRRVLSFSEKPKGKDLKAMKPVLGQLDSL